MFGVVIEIRRYVNDDQPGWVECSLTDARGREWLFIEKVPVVAIDNLDADSHYPAPGVIACRVVGRHQRDGRELVVIDTELPYHVQATTGETRFEVGAEQLVEWD